MNKKLALAAVLTIGLAGSANAAIQVDEATYPGASGDYNNLLLLIPPVTFALEGGTNLFRGTFGTPGDGGDTVVLDVGPLQTITAIRITFATNADPFNPVAINQGSPSGARYDQFVEPDAHPRSVDHRSPGRTRSCSRRTLSVSVRRATT